MEEQLNQITQVAARPLSWAEVVDTLWDVVNSNKKVWLEEIKKLDTGGASNELKKAIPGVKSVAEHGVVLKCGAFGGPGGDLSAMTNFRRDLKTNPKVTSLFNIVNIAPDYKVNTTDNSLSFVVSLLKAPIEEAKKGAEAKKAGKRK